MKRVLICIEHGAPAELLRDALKIGSVLVDRGHRVGYVVGDPVSLVDFAGSWIPEDLHQAPVLRAAPSLVMKRPEIDGFADVIADRGFDDKQALMTLSAMWSTIFESLQPAIIVAFYSPIVWMLGPAVAPTIALGRGFSMPPVLGRSFPRWTPQTSPLVAEEVILANANAALGRLGYPALGMLSEILGRCTSLIYGVPAFDPYLQLRRVLSAGLLRWTPAAAAIEPTPRLAAFVDASCPGSETIILALAGCDTSVDVFVAGITTGMRRFLEQSTHVRLWPEHAALLEHAVHARAIMHHGEQDVAERAMSLGRPQLLVPWTREQRMFAEMVKWMGVAWFKEPSASVDDFAGTFRAILRNGSLVVAAQHHAMQLEKLELPDVVPVIVATIEQNVLGNLTGTSNNGFVSDALAMEPEGL